MIFLPYVCTIDVLEKLLAMQYVHVRTTSANCTTVCKANGLIYKMQMDSPINLTFYVILL
jgi:hypothetical protein